MIAKFKQGDDVVAMASLTDGKLRIIGPEAAKVREWLVDEHSTVWGFTDDVIGPMRMPSPMDEEWLGRRSMGRPVWATWATVEFTGWSPRPWPDLPEGTVA